MAVLANGQPLPVAAEPSGLPGAQSPAHAGPVRIRIPGAGDWRRAARNWTRHPVLRAAITRLKQIPAAIAPHALRLLRRQIRPIASRADAGRISRSVLKLAGFYVALSLLAAVTVISAGAILFGADQAPTVTAPIPTETPERTGSTAATDPWVRLARPLNLYSIDAPEFAKLPQQHQARRHSIGNGREDRFTVGDFAGLQLYYDVRLYRPGGEQRADSTLFVETVRRLAGDGLTVTRMAADEQHRTKFGMASVADATVQDGERQRHCLAFRLGGTGDPLTIAGLACGAETRPLDRAMLTCFIDRISLLASGDDAALRNVFSSAELSRHAGCTKSSLTSVGRKATWLDADGAAPAFKPALAETEKPARGKRKKSAQRRD